MAALDAISYEALRAALHYEPETGIFTWASSGRSRCVGREVGSWDMHGYKTIRLGGRSYKLHRLAIFYMTGEWPAGDVDHINGVRSDNRYLNLRDVPRRTNLENRKRRNPGKPSGLPLGVHRDKKRFEARISLHNTNHVIGRFDTPEQAEQAYLEAKRKLHSGCTI